MRIEQKKKIITKSLIVLLLFITLAFFCCIRKEKPEYVFNSAIRLWKKGAYYKSLKTFESFLDLYSNHNLSPKVSLWIGDIRYIYLNNPIQAIYDYRRLIKNYPKSEYASKAQWKIAEVLSNDLLEKIISIKEYQNFIRLYPFHPLVPKAYYNIAEAYIYLEDYGQAITELELFVRKYPKAEIIQKVYYKLGELYFLVKSFTKAISFLEKAHNLDNNKTNSETIKLIAECYINKGEIQRGIDLYKKILDYEPENITISKRIESLETRLNIKEKRQKW